MKLKTNLINPLATLAILGVMFGGIRGCNSAWNNKTIEKPSYTTNSRASGLFGHVEFTKYADGSYDVKVYPKLAHRYFNSQLNQDLDGDGLVDRIRQNGSEVRMNSLKKILIRESDYLENKELFDSADSQLQSLIEEYSK